MRPNFEIRVPSDLVITLHTGETRSGRSLYLCDRGIAMQVWKFSDGPTIITWLEIEAVHYQRPCDACWRSTGFTSEPAISNADPLSPGDCAACSGTGRVTEPVPPPSDPSSGPTHQRVPSAALRTHPKSNP